jgi:hypothetical protein
MERLMKAELAAEIGTERVRRIIGPDWPSLAREIVDQVWDALGIKELVASHNFVVEPSYRVDEARIMHIAKERAARAIANKIVENTPMQITTLRDPTSAVYPTTRMEVRVLTITSMPR